MIRLLTAFDVDDDVGKFRHFNSTNLQTLHYLAWFSRIPVVCSGFGASDQSPLVPGAAQNIPSLRGNM